MTLQRWKGGFFDEFGKITELQILENQDGGQSYDDWLPLTFSDDNPLSLQYNYSRDLFVPIVNLGATVNLLTLYDGQYTAFGFSTTEKQYKAIVARDGAVIFSGLCRE